MTASSRERTLDPVMRRGDIMMRGKLKYLTLFFAGALADLALAPFYIFPVLFLSFPALLIALEKSRSNKQAFWSGWWFGFGYFVFGLYWIANSLLVDAAQFAWLIPFAVCGIPSVAAIYIGVAGVLFRWLCHARLRAGIRIPAQGGDDKFLKTLMLAASWTLLEFARSYFPFGGFPWNLIGYSALFSIQFAQFAWVGGIFMMSFLVIVISCAPLIWKNKSAITALVLLLMFLFGFGYYHMKYSEREKINMQVKLVQPNIKQEMKWDEEAKYQNYVETLKLAASGKKADLIILPESGAPYHLNRQDEPLKMLQSIVPEGSAIITGALRSEGNTNVWNTLYMVGDGVIIDFYDKHHLVPFGEYVPFRSVLPIEKITPGIGDFSRGEAGKTIDFKGRKFLPLICYEIIFPRYSDLSENYDFIVNITNDAWFGVSSGPYQHLAAAQMRAIEGGVPVIRVANTGVSAIISLFGQVVSSIKLEEGGVVSADIGEKVLHKSIYSRYNNLPILLAIIFIMIFSVARVRKP